MAIKKRIKTDVINKHDIEANWNKAVNFTPEKGQIIVYDRDDNLEDETLRGTHSCERMKIGDGVTNVAQLPFVNDTINNLPVVQIKNWEDDD